MIEKAQPDESTLMLKELFKESQLIWLFVALFSSSSMLCAQKERGRLRSIDHLWNTMEFADETEQPVPRDTMVVMFTNRVLIDTVKHFFSHQIDHDRPMLPLLVTCHYKNWTVYQDRKSVV